MEILESNVYSSRVESYIQLSCEDLHAFGKVQVASSLIRPAVEGRATRICGAADTCGPGLHFTNVVFFQSVQTVSTKPDHALTSSLGLQQKGLDLRRIHRNKLNNVFLFEILPDLISSLIHDFKHQLHAIVDCAIISRLKLMQWNESGRLDHETIHHVIFLYGAYALHWLMLWCTYRHVVL